MKNFYLQFYYYAHCHSPLKSPNSQVMWIGTITEGI